MQLKMRKIAVADIQMDRPDPAKRTLDKDFCAKLALTIESEGLLYEPIVQPAAGGKYRVICGMHRIYTCGKLLGWTEIPCKVTPDGITEDQAKAIHIADNLWRNNFTPDQLAIALIEWKELYDRSHPIATSGSGTGGRRQAEVRSRVAKAREAGQEADVAAITAQVEEETRPFARAVGEALGLKKTAAARLARIASSLTREQVEMLAACEVNETIKDKIVALADPEKIDRAVKLIASGMPDHEEAVRSARQGPDKDRGKPKAAPAKPVRDSDLTDDEWLNAHCPKIMSILRRKAAFKRDAILYRRLMSTALPAFRKSAEKMAQQHKGKEAGDNGSFYQAVNRTVSCKHPGEWLACGHCDGSGKTAEGKMCPQCQGAAYRITLESP